MGCCAWLFGPVVRCSYRDSDSEEDRHLKALFVPVYAGFGALFVIFTTYWASWGGFNDFASLGLMTSAVGLLCCGLLPSIATALSPRTVVMITAVPFLVSCFLLDFRNAWHKTERTWPFGIIIMDALLIVDGAALLQSGVVTSVMVWLVLIGALGMADARGMYLVANFGHAGEKMQLSVCECAAPPIDSGVIDAITATQLFIVDFLITGAPPRAHNGHR
eukprot:gene50979-1633_t